MSNSLRWKPALLHLQAVELMLEFGLAFLGFVLGIGGRDWSPHPILAGIVIATAVGIVIARRRPRLQWLHQADAGHPDALAKPLLNEELKAAGDPKQFG